MLGHSGCLKIAGRLNPWGGKHKEQEPVVREVYYIMTSGIMTTSSLVVPLNNYNNYL